MPLGYLMGIVPTGRIARVSMTVLEMLVICAPVSSSAENLRCEPPGGTSQSTSTRILASATSNERNRRSQARLAEKMPNSIGSRPISFMEKPPKPHLS